MSDELNTVRLGNDEADAEYLNDMMQSIRDGTVIPILSNSLRLEAILRDVQELVTMLGDKPEFADEDQTLEEQLTKKWAERIEYPMTDDHNLARVAQYDQVNQGGGGEKAKSKYLRFIKEFLLERNSGDPNYSSFATGALKVTHQYMFSDIVKELGYPRSRASAREDTLTLLAKLPLKIYITTSYFDFLERALIKAGKTPCTQICLWNGGKSNIPSKFWQIPDDVPSENQPLVFHLFGLENYAQTLVMSEDDYITFLVSIFQATNELNPLVPIILREALGEQRLMLLGYHLRDWDFRVLFRFIMKFRTNPDLPQGIAIQLKPSYRGEEKNMEKSVKYLEQYFEKKQFKVDWMSTERFIYQLWKTWKAYSGTADNE